MKTVTIILLSMLMFSSCSKAAPDELTYSTHCFSGVPSCSKNINDLVTEKFMTRFPGDKWIIVLFSDVHKLSDGSSLAISIAGVVPSTADAIGKSTTQFPVNRFVRSRKSSGVVNSSASQRLELNVLRDAVEKLMEQCEEKTNCEVYTPQE